MLSMLWATYAYKYSTWLSPRTSEPRTIVCGRRPNPKCVAPLVRQRRKLLPKRAKTLLRQGARAISALWQRAKRKARNDSRTRRSLIRALQRTNQRRRQKKELRMPISELKNVLIDFVNSNPLDENVWRRDFELGWPYVT